MNDFEKNLQKLEQLTNDIKQNDITLEQALKDFEEGIKLAKTLEKELNAIEAKVQILTNSPDIEDSNTTSKEEKPTKKTKSKSESPMLDLFNMTTEINGTRNA